MFFIHAGYLACARCASTGALVLIEPVSTINGADQPLSRPKTERCSNCSGSGKVGHQILSIFLYQVRIHCILNFFCLLLFCSCLPFLHGISYSTGISIKWFYLFILRLCLLREELMSYDKSWGKHIMCLFGTAAKPQVSCGLAIFYFFLHFK